MKNRQKMIIWLMLVTLLFSESTHLVSISNQVVWAQEESETLKSTEKQEKTASTETSVNQIQSEETTETSQIQTQTSSQQEENEGSSKTQISTEKTVTESSTKEEASQTSKTSIQPQAGNVDDNPGAKQAYAKAASYWTKQLTSRLASAPKLGNYTGASSKLDFTLPVDSAPETSLTSSDQLYKWKYKTNVYFQSMSFLGGDGIVFKGGVYLETVDGKKVNHFIIDIQRTKPGSNVTIPSISAVYYGDMQADEYARNYFTGEYVWNKVDYLTKGNVSVGLGGLTCNLESSDMPSKYSGLYDEWRKASVQKIASNLADSLKSNYSKLGKNVNDTVNFTIASKVNTLVGYAATVQFYGDYYADLSQFQVDLSGNFSTYVQLEKTGSTGTTISYRMKRVKVGDFTDGSVTISTRHDAEGRTITIADGTAIFWALPMKNIPLDSASADFKDERQIWADPVEQTIELGAGKFLSEVPDVSKLITNVRLEDGTALSASEYTAQISSRPTFDNMAITEKIVVTLTRKATGIVSTVSVPVKMSWGNTIQLRGVEDKTAGAYTLKNVGGSYSIRANYGQDKNYSPNGVHNYFGDTPYHSITLLRGTGNIEKLSSTYYKETNGTDTAKEVVENFGTSGEQSVQLGDVVKIWHKEQWRNSYFKDEKASQYSTQNEGITYFAVTANGFVPYRLNQLKPKETTITTKTTNAELDKQAGDLIDFLGMSGNGLKVSKITEYPDRSKAGTVKGKVQVEETIDGHTYTYEYEVPFKVTDDRQIWADVVEQTIELGTWSGEIPDVSKMITNVRLEDGTAINPSGYTVEITSVPSFDNMKVTDKISVKITRKSNGVVTYLQVPVKMAWGNTIQLRGIGDGSAGAFTLHKVANGYYLRATYGQDRNYYTSGIHAYFPDTYYSIRLLRGTGLINQLTQTYSQEFNGSFTTPDIISQFGTNSQQSVQLGDVVEIWHEEQSRNSYFKDEKESKYFAENNKVVYFAVTADGFVPYRLNQLKANEMTINMSTINEELDQKKEDMIDFLGLSGNNLKVSKISQYPDRSKAGTAKGKVLVEETIDGHTYTYEYEVPFQVEDDRQPQADVVEQTISLGTKANELKAIDMVKNVRLEDGTVINPSGYTVEIISTPSFDNMTVTKKIEVRLTRKSNNQSIDLSVPVKMSWGNTIQLRGYNSGTSGAYTLKNIGGSYSIRANYGQDKNYSSSGVHGFFGDTPYHSITLLRGTGNIEQLSSTYYKETNGTDTAKEVVENFGMSGEQSVQLGDVVKIWHKEQWRNSYFKDEEAIKYSTQNEGITYFAVTANGFVPYRLNQLKANEMTILTSTTDAELDQKKGDMIDFLGLDGNDLKVSKISQYPDRSKAGTAQGKVLVEETIDGQTHTYEYQVTFNVLNDLNVSAKQIVDIPLGTTLSNEAKEYVTVTSTPEDEGKLTFEWVGEPISASTVGTHQAVVRVTSPTFSKSVDVTIDYKVLYGNSIVMGTDSSVALSLLNEGGKPKLAATPGTPKEKLSLRSFISIYRHSLVNLLTLLKTDTVYQKPEQLAETWNSLITKQSYSYGDVLVVSAYKRDDPNLSLQGSETYVSRNEMLVKESEGYDDAFYELTPTGYSLLHINRLTPEIQEIEQGTSEEELDKRVSEFLSTKNYNNIQVKKFSMYPDTSKVGGSTSIITVSETLKSGGTFEYQYPVSFLVKAPNLTLKTNLSVTNLSRTEEETKVGDELLYSYTLTNDSPIGILKTGNLSVELPEGLEAVTRSEQTIPLTELAAGETFTHQLMVKVTDQALNQNPVVKVTGKATNESTVEQEIPEATVDVPGSLVTEVDASEIDITIPTKMNFGSEDKKIISPVYKMENNSTTPVEVLVDQFTPDQKLEGKNLLLNITSGNQSVTLYENEQGFNQIQSLLTLGSREIKQLSFNGSVNQQTEVSQSSSTLRLRFKSIK
ncbi:hypothetical protein [Enterococcus sp. DIV0660C]|uniref:hypothetical protein n=1 Tax=Enterococcus sp. DIV0660C TaxID=2230880 RepID=UPI001A8E6A0F|nr:hypothetical protein [Enterococcus sp. DIV0660C]MBO0432697.1 hypothetical protein [Enterococcus sp. DIV0660C]